jgi:hypothetical protein
MAPYHLRPDWLIWFCVDIQLPEKPRAGEFHDLASRDSLASGDG